MWWRWISPIARARSRARCTWGTSRGTIVNPGPFATPVELPFLASIARDPLGESPQNRPQTPNFRSNKGPMTTQTLRGMANHGAQHWRGDRTRRFQSEPGRQPNFGSLDEDNSFGKFDVAIMGLNGNDVPLSPEVFQAFTNFTLQITLPPNPVRALDDSLTAEQARGRALYFGCESMSDEEFARGRCTAEGGASVVIDEATQDCFCALNPLVSALGSLPPITGFAGLLEALFANPDLRAAFLGLAADTSGLPAAEHAVVARRVESLAGAIDQLASTSLALDERGLLPFASAGVLSGLSGNVLALLQLSSTHGTPTGNTLLGLLAGSIPPGALPAESPLRTPAGLAATFQSTFTLANFDLRVVADELSRGTSDFRDLLGGCDVRRETECRLRITDSFDSCHGCHTLDPRGNAPFDVYRPGFFGTSGAYSFENESQMFKVPHLRNLYQKVGMFGMAEALVAVPESTLGVRAGGFFAESSAYQGPQVRGFGFLHDGSTDTLFRFHGAVVFSESTPGAPLGAPGTERGLPQAVPDVATRAECLASVRTAPRHLLRRLPAERRATLELCLESSPLPDDCFLDPLAATCQSALVTIAAERGEPAFAERFLAEVRPLCFQLGSALEGGSNAGACYPRGLRERAELEAFMLAFDSNLKPSVGQQVTLSGAHCTAEQSASLGVLVSAAAKRHCDAAVHQRGAGYLMLSPDPAAPLQSRMQDASGNSLVLADLSELPMPLTLTCYPPQADLAEARRAAFGR